jgi:predicted glutamine amidotransferase
MKKMCELHLISKKEELTIKDIDEMANFLTYGAQSNKDGYGVTNGFKVIKDGKKYEQADKKQLYQLFNEKEKSTFLIAHNRFKTQGDATKENAHPFETEHFIYAHNGIIYNADELASEENEVIKVDTEIIGILLEKHNGEDFKTMFKRVFESLKGSFSVFVFEKKTKRLFYIKNNASFYFKLFVNKGALTLAGSTNEGNLLSVFNDLETKTENGLFKKTYIIKEELTPEEKVIYEIEGVKIKALTKPLNISEYVPIVYKTIYGDYSADGFCLKDNSYNNFFNATKKERAPLSINDLKNNLEYFFNYENISISVRDDGFLKLDCSDDVSETLRSYCIYSDKTSEQELSDFLQEEREQDNRADY